MGRTYGYIYIRNHRSYDIYHACKLGKTSDIKKKDELYVSNELRRGYFKVVFEVPYKKMKTIKRLIEMEFSALNIRYDGGTEFYDKIIINMTEPYLKKLRINYKKLSRKEINDLLK